MGYVQIGKHVLVNGEIIAIASPDGNYVEAILCDMCNEIKEYASGFTFENGVWQCSKCLAIN